MDCVNIPGVNYTVVLLVDCFWLQSKVLSRNKVMTRQNAQLQLSFPSTYEFTSDKNAKPIKTLSLSFIMYSGIARHS